MTPGSVNDLTDVHTHTHTHNTMEESYKSSGKQKIYIKTAIFGCSVSCCDGQMCICTRKTLASVSAFK